MNAINIKQCNMSNNDIVISKNVIVKIMYVLAYVVIYVINYKRINAYFNKKEEKVEEEKVEEEKVEEEKVEEEESEEKDWDILTKETKHKEKDVNKWYIIPGHVLTRYKGEWRNGLAHGKGIREVFGCSGVDHSIMEGNFIDGKFTGYGKQTFDITRDEEEFAPYYEGEFKDHSQHGNGAYYYGTGSYRKGNLVEGKFEGKGIYYDHIKNQTWVGIFVDDKRGEGEWFDGEIIMKETLEDKVTENVQVKMR